ncbi:hypothetical protein Tco_0428877, partial [Tanacetum coccineum]
MPTKIELTLEQSQQGVSNDVLDKMTVLQPHSSEVGFINHMLILKLSKSILYYELDAEYEQKNRLDANETFFKEIREFEQIFDELDAEYEQCVLDNKNLT